MRYKFQKGDIVTLNAEVIGVTGSGNPIVRFNSGVKVLVKYSDVNTIRPAVKVDGETRERETNDRQIKQRRSRRSSKSD